VLFLERLLWESVATLTVVMSVIPARKSLPIADWLLQETVSGIADNDAGNSRMAAARELGREASRRRQHSESGRHEIFDSVAGNF